jgi:hypothetical protein
MGEPTNLRSFSFPILGRATKRDAPALKIRPWPVAAAAKLATLILLFDFSTILC